MLKDNIIDNVNIKPNSNEIEKLKMNFPQYFDKEGEFLLDRFKEMLKQNDVTLTKEGYELKFLGKSYARYLSSIKTETFIVPHEEENEKEAIKFYLKAAEKSNPLALFNVGNYYEENKNIKLAKQYYSKVLHVLKEYPDILKEYSASDLETETMNRLLYLEKNFDEDAETE